MATKDKDHDDYGMYPLLGVPARGIIPYRILRSKYPISFRLGLRPVSVNGNDHEGFDIDEVEKKLGNEKFQLLVGQLKEVFCCGHRNWPANHPDPIRRNAEVHCIYAWDVESFLKSQTRPAKGE
jgi:hypothetical protein